MSRPNSSNGHRVLKAYRQIHNMTQQHMADHIGIDISTYNNKENKTGTADFTLQEARTISLLLNKSIEQIFFTQEINI